LIYLLYLSHTRFTNKSYAPSSEAISACIRAWASRSKTYAYIALQGRVSSFASASTWASARFRDCKSLCGEEEEALVALLVIAPQPTVTKIIFSFF
jgi:hypothetical protein